MKTNITIKCKNCGTEMEMDELFMKQLEPLIRQKFENEFEERLEEAGKSTLLQFREKEKIINDLKSQLSDALRKASLGSQQLQGEVQEIEIVKILRELYPHDEIMQSKKGTNAADVLQLVKTQDGSECGKIYYESKRTSTWSNGWIDKLKKDNLNSKADILVLITNAFPRDMKRSGIIDGVFVIGMNDIKEATMFLRYSLLKLHAVAITQNGKEGKMELLYKYLTSTDFQDTFSAIIDGFKKIQESHHGEKIKIQRIWKEREKMLEQVLFNSIEFYSSIKGIAGSAIPEIKMLELPQAED